MRIGSFSNPGAGLDLGNLALRYPIGVPQRSANNGLINHFKNLRKLLTLTDIWQYCLGISPLVADSGWQLGCGGVFEVKKEIPDKQRRKPPQCLLGGEP